MKQKELCDCYIVKSLWFEIATTLEKKCNVELLNLVQYIIVFGSDAMITSLLYTLFLSSSTSTLVHILDKTHVYQVSYET